MALQPRLSAVASLLLIAVALALFLLSLRSVTQLPKRLVIVLALCAMLGAVAVPPRGSSDIWSYISYGRIVALHESSPYTHPPQDFPDDPFTAKVAPGWRHLESVYGPLFTGISANLAYLAGDSLTRARALQQALEAMAVVALAIYLRSSRAWLLLCLNPAVIAIVNGGHNDLLMGTLVAVGVLLLNKRLWSAAGLAIGAAISVKAAAALPAVVIAIWLLGRNRKAAARFSGIVVLLTIVIYALAGGTNAAAPLFSNASYMSRSSLLTLPHHLLPQLTGAFTVLIFTVLLWWFVKRAKQPSEYVLSANNAAIFSTPYVLPWYCGWSLPLAAVVGPAFSTWVALAQSSALLLAYAVPPGQSTGTVIGVVSALAMPSALGFSLIAGRSQQRIPDSPKDDAGEG